MQCLNGAKLVHNLTETKMEGEQFMATVIVRKRIKGWVLATVLLAISTMVLSTLLIVENARGGAFAGDLEMVYQRSFYELTDNVNSLDMKLAKILAASSATYQGRLLKEASTNAAFAEQSLSIMPLETAEMKDIHKFFNQVAGYTEYLSANNAAGLNAQDRITMNKIREAVGDIRNGLNQISLEVQKGFNIIQNLNKMTGDTNAFASVMSEMKSQDIEFPTMIFDGPFSEAQLNKAPKGLPTNKVSQAEAELAVVALLALEQPFTITFLEKASGTFTTFDFKVEKDGVTKFVSISELGGKLITMSGETNRSEANFSLQDARRVALEFVGRNGIESAQVVWDDEINSDIYLNIAPVIDNIVIYPDLIKVKVDLYSGQVIGYEASSYYLNHVDRNLQTPTFDMAAARSQVTTLGFTVLTTKLCLAPIKYRDEVLCFEFSAQKSGETYYFFINAISGEEEEIMKVVQQNDGTLLS